ncbi:MAG: glycosyltransferase family 1 protein [Bacteroidetes bacterium]|nr:glycosyltransferase family 1 protein [bacterium]NBP66185.1 glycosyltransferase family 1 protein [Bacteroidota bacterium]
MLPVLHLITTINRGGAENQLLILVGQQISMGREVKVCYLKGEPELNDKFLKIGAEVITELASKPTWRQVLYLRKILNSRRYILHAHLPRAQLVAAFANKNSYLVTSRHDAERFNPNGNKFLSILLSRIVAKRTDVAIAISHAVRKAMMSYKEFPKEFKIEVVHYGIELETKKVISETGSFKKEFYLESRKGILFGTLARIVDQKDFPTLLLGFKEYCSKFGDSHLIIAGEGNLRQSMTEYSRQLGIDKKVTWLGNISETDDFLSILDVFVLASKIEGFGLVLLEAMRCGVPIIGSNASAIPEVIGSGNGLIFNSGNPQELSFAMEECRNPSLRKHLGERSNTRIKHFDSRKMALKLDNIYKSLEMEDK